MNDKSTQVNIMTKDQSTSIPVVLNSNNECRVKNTKKEYGKIMKSLTKTKHRQLVNFDSREHIHWKIQILKL